MAKGGKLMKKLSFGKTTQTNTTTSSSVASIRSSDTSFSSSTDATLHPVYVGKSRKQYLLPADVVGHPLIQQLAAKSDEAEAEATVVVGCEVVLFEHLLWMLENTDPMPESLAELADFYAC